MAMRIINNAKNNLKTVEDCRMYNTDNLFKSVTTQFNNISTGIPTLSDKSIIGNPHVIDPNSEPWPIASAIWIENKNEYTNLISFERLFSVCGNSLTLVNLFYALLVMSPWTSQYCQYMFVLEKLEPIEFRRYGKMTKMVSTNL